MRFQRARFLPHLFSSYLAILADNVGVEKFRQQGHVQSRDGEIGIVRIGARILENGQREIEDVGISGYVSVGDAVALRCKVHCRYQCHALRLIADVSLFDLAEAGRIGDADRFEGVGGVLFIKSSEGRVEAAA